MRWILVVGVVACGRTEGRATTVAGDEALQATVDALTDRVEALEAHAHVTTIATIGPGECGPDGDTKPIDVPTPADGPRPVVIYRLSCPNGVSDGGAFDNVTLANLRNDPTRGWGFSIRCQDPQCSYDVLAVWRD